MLNAPTIVGIAGMTLEILRDPNWVSISGPALPQSLPNGKLIFPKELKEESILFEDMSGNTSTVKIDDIAAIYTIDREVFLSRNRPRNFNDSDIIALAKFSKERTVKEMANPLLTSNGFLLLNENILIKSEEVNGHHRSISFLNLDRDSEFRDIKTCETHGDVRILTDRLISHAVNFRVLPSNIAPKIAAHIATSKRLAELKENIISANL